MDGELAVGLRIQIRVAFEEYLRFQILVTIVGGADVNMLDAVVLPRHHGAEAVTAVFAGFERALVLRCVITGTVGLADVDGGAGNRLAVGAAHPAADAHRLTGISLAPQVERGGRRDLGGTGGAAGVSHQGGGAQRHQGHQ